MATEYSYIGKGKIYIGPYADNAKRRFIGNVSELTMTAEEDVKELGDFTSSGGGSANKIRRIKSVSATMQMREISAENLALAAFGSTTAVAAGTITDEAKTAYKGGLVRTNFNVDTGASVTVTGAGGTPTYVNGTDYTVSAAGIFIVAAGAIADGANVLIDYTKKAGQVIQALVSSAPELKMTFLGLNEAQSDLPVVVDVHRFKPGPFQNLSLIGDDYGALQLTGEVLSDSAIVTAGLSKFFKVEMAN